METEPTAERKPTNRATTTDRMPAYRARQRAPGLRPVQYWVPDKRNPKVRKEIQRQAALLDSHPETQAISDRLDAMLDDRESE